jgi:hypothetical protein
MVNQPEPSEIRPSAKVDFLNIKPHMDEAVRCGASTEDGEASAGDWRWGSPRCKPFGHTS